MQMEKTLKYINSEADRMNYLRRAFGLKRWDAESIERVYKLLLDRE